MYEDALYDALTAWASGVTGLVAIRDNQSGPRPSGDYVMINIISDAGDEIFSEAHSLDGATLTTCAVVDATASINVYADRPLDVAKKLKTSARRGEQLLLEPFIFMSATAIRRLPKLVQAKHEGRAQFDIRLGGVYEDTRPVDTIETIRLETCVDLYPVGPQPKEVTK